jgi:hypothetical protein
MILSTIAGAVAIGAMLLASPESHAAPSDEGLVVDAQLFCDRLDVDSSPAGIDGEVVNMINDGLSKERAVDTLDYALTYVCPWYQDEFMKALDEAKKDIPLLRAV